MLWDGRDPGRVKNSYPLAQSSWILNYLFAKQFIMLDLLRNQQHPRNRTTDRTAVAHKRAWKKRVVRIVEVVVNPNLLRVSLVMATESSPLEKIQELTKWVRKLLYESSRVFFSLTFGSIYGVRARFTVLSNWLSISACGLSISSMTLAYPSSSFLVCAEGRASALSAPLVPHETSCQLLNA